MTPGPEPLVLDTHVLLAFATGAPGYFSDQRLEALAQAASVRGLFIPAIVLWELAMLESRQRIRLLPDCQSWLESIVGEPGITVAALTPQIVTDSTRLPGAFHADPADRLIVATARALGGMLLTRDQAILAYAGQGHVMALPPK